MKCRYCGKDLRPINDVLWATNGKQCAGNGGRNHVALSDGTNCVYCGRAVRTVANKLCTSFGFKCSTSPTGGHSLQ